MAPTKLAHGVDVAGVVALLRSCPEWMVRRKLTINLLDESWHRKRLSVDVDMESALAVVSADSSDKRSRPNVLKRTRLSVPVTFLFKSPEATMDFNFERRNGDPLSLARFSENLAANAAVVLTMGRDLLDLDSGEETPDGLSRLVTAAGTASPYAASLGWASAFRDNVVPRELSDDPIFMWVAWRSLEKALVICDVPVGAPHEILKLDFVDRSDRDTTDERDPATGARPDGESAGWAPYTFRFWSDSWPCGAFHVELSSPDGLEAIGASLVACDPRPAHQSPGAGAGFSEHPVRVETAVDDPASPDRVHLYATDLGGRGWWYSTRVSFRASRVGFVSKATLATSLNACLLTWLIVALNGVRHESDASTALLLAGSGLATTAIIELSSVPLAVHLLRVVRRATTASAALVLLAAVWFLSTASSKAELSWTSLGIHIPPDVWIRGPLVVCALLAWSMAAVAHLARQLPMVDGGTPPLTIRGLQAVTRPMVKLLGRLSVVDAG